jgi:hypothetical protein
MRETPCRPGASLVILTFKQFGTGRKSKARKPGHGLAVANQISLSFKQLARPLHVAISSATLLDIGYLMVPALLAATAIIRINCRLQGVEDPRVSR